MNQKLSGSHNLSALGRMGTGVVGLVVLFALLTALNIVVRNARVRMDMTEERLYSLSSGSMNTMRQLDRPVTLKLFFNRSNPAVPHRLKTYARQVEDLLREYELASRGKIELETYDPRMDSEDEEWAQKYGLKGQQLEMFGPAFYFGLVAVSGSSEATLPTLDPGMQHLLEYNITRLIHAVTNPQKPRVGVYSSLPVLGRPRGFGMPGEAPPSPPWFVFDDLRKQVDLQPVESLQEGVPGDLDLLIVAHPKGLGKDSLFALDQFILAGGRVLVLVDPLSYADDAGRDATMRAPETHSDLGLLFDAWGLEFDAHTVVVDAQASTPVRTADNRIEHNPLIVTYSADNLNTDDVTTAGLNTLRAVFAGVLQDRTKDSLTVTPLVTTNPDALLASTHMLQMGADALRRQAQPAGAALPIAVRIEGTFPTAFPDGDPDSDKEVAPQGPLRAEGRSIVAVIADMDMLHNDVCVEAINFFGQRAFRPLNDNPVFFANLVEQMAGSPDLIEIRSRGIYNRPFERVDALERAALARWQETEDEIQKRLRHTQQRLHELQQATSDDQRLLLTAQQQREIEAFRQEEFRLRRNLQDVRRNLNRDIEALGLRLKLINIGLMPTLIACAGIVVGLYRIRH